MTRQEFAEKLTPFFTTKQIEQLDRAALESAQDAHAQMEIDAKTLHDIGRDFIAVLIYDTAEDPAEMKQCLDIEMTPEAREALLEQFNIEW